MFENTMAAIWCRQLGHRRKEDAHKVQKHECKGRFPKITFLSHTNMFFLFSRKCQHIFWAYPAVKVYQVNCSHSVSSSAPEKMKCPPHSQPNTIWSSYGSETSYSSRMICSVPVVAAHHLPAGLGGQRSCPTVDV